MNKVLLWIAAGLAVLIGGYFIFTAFGSSAPAPVQGAVDYKNATYLIEGKPVTLVNGMAEMEAAPGSSSKIITKYFGNEVTGDINGDGIPDVAFLLTQESGGSGTFFYVVGAVKQADGTYKGTDGVLLGDRVAPQTTEMSKNPNQKNVLIVNYADRLPGEPMTARPSQGKSLYLKLDPETMQFGIVVQNFEGEAAAALSEPQARAIAEKSCIKGGEALAAGVHNKGTQTWWFDANLNATKPGCSPACVVSEVTKTAEINWRCTGLITQ